MLRRGFPKAEIVQRIEHLRARMDAAKWDAILLSSEHDIRYYTGFHSQFWQSLTRPWFVLIPRELPPIAVIPAIGVAGISETVISDIRFWSSPDPVDDGVSLLTQSINSLPRQYGRMGVPMGVESFLRLPQNDWQRVCASIHFSIEDAQEILLRARMVKSAVEIEKIRFCAETTSGVMHDLCSYVQQGMTEREMCQVLRTQLITAGIDHSPFLIAGSGHGGYADIIMGPSDRVPQRGDVMIIDTGSQYDGYFCDFDRNYAFGDVPSETLTAHEKLWQATNFVLERLYGGILASEVARMFAEQLGQADATDATVGRMGHGLGMGLTEWPSIHPAYNVALPAGAVMTLEPAYMLGKTQMLVHEENVLITEKGAELLSIRTPQEMLRVN